jgi:hypothetical protein
VDNGILSDWKAKDCEREVLFRLSGEGLQSATICELTPEDEAKYDLRNDKLIENYEARKDLTSVEGNAARYQDAEVAAAALAGVAQVLKGKDASRSPLFYREGEQCLPVCGPPAFDQIICLHPEMIPRHSSFTQQMQEMSVRLQMVLDPQSAAIAHVGAHHVTMQGLCNAGLLDKYFCVQSDRADTWPPMQWSPQAITNVKTFDEAVQRVLLPHQREVMQQTFGNKALSLKLRFTRMCLTSDGSIILLATEE